MCKLFLIIILFSFSASAQNPMSRLLQKKSGAAPFTPTDIAGLNFWVKADQITGLSDGDPVSTWQDQSGNGFDITSTLTLRPTYKTAIQNGKPIVRFDGSNDVLFNATYSGLSSIAGRTVFVVYAHASTANPGTMLTATSGTFANVAIYVQPYSDGNIYEAVSVTGSDYGYYALATTSFSLFESVYDGTLSGNSNVLKLYNNASLQSSSYGGTIPSTTPAGVTQISVGNDNGGISAPFAGDIAEILVYNTALSGTDRALVETYLNSRWAVY